MPLPPRILFITGTDTGVGKTVLTALLLAHLRRTGVRALALKPFCCGNRADARLLHALQDGELTLDEINPFFFPEPLAPLVAARKHRRTITLQAVLTHIRSILPRLISPPIHQSTNPSLHPSAPPVLLIEGVGGLLVPLGRSFTVLDLISGLAAPSSRSSETRNTQHATRAPLSIFIVSRNQLGTLNHTLLTIRALQHALSLPRNSQPATRNPLRLSLRVILMAPRSPDPSSASNLRLLSEMLAPVPSAHLRFFQGRRFWRIGARTFLSACAAQSIPADKNVRAPKNLSCAPVPIDSLPFLGPHCLRPANIQANVLRLRRVLARLA